MTFVEQTRMVEDLRLFHSKMDRREQEDFAMMLKRQKDDEQFDNLTQMRLQVLHKKYVPARTKAQIEEAWKRLAGNRSDKGGAE